MTNLELRDELLAQHDELRELAKIVKAAAKNATSGPKAPAELRALLAQLADELLAHNKFEEQALAVVLPELDAWGAERELRVAELHAAEHAVIYAALAGLGEPGDAAWLAGETLDVLELLTAHIDREDSELLRADVLRDDIITSGVGG